MRTITKFLTVVTAVTALFIGGANAQSFAAGGNVSEKTIEQQVFRKMVYLPNYGVFDHINFQVDGSTVILGGRVNSLGTRRDAASAAKRVPGVTRVINNIEQLPPSSFDNGIRRGMLRTFGRTGLATYLREPRPSVRIIVENGRVTLEGYVSGKGDYNMFNVLANGVPGVFSVENNLVIGKDRRQ